MKLAAIENPGSRREELGQFLTATPAADFMAYKQQMWDNEANQE